MKSRTDLYTSITDKIINLLTAQKGLKFTQPWVNVSGGGLARNAATQRPYNSINQLLLSMAMLDASFQKNTWLTFNQISALGGKIRKGSKGLPVVFYASLFKDKAGKKMNPKEASKLNAAEQLAQGVKMIPFLRQYYVFNISQTEGLPSDMYLTTELAQFTDIQKDDAAENVMNSTKAVIKFANQNRAYYHPVTDEIQLPIRAQFRGTEPFYETVFHELVHWTGHQSRLNRTFGKGKDSKEYAFEELVAELGTAFVCAHLGFESCITNNAAYIESWLNHLDNDKRFIIRAATQAQKAADFILQQAERNEIAV